MAEKKQINFEENMARLKKIVDTISDKALPLDESIKLYEEGNKIIKELEKALKDAEKQVEDVIEVK